MADRPTPNCPYCGETEHIVENKRWTIENRKGTIEVHIKWRCLRMGCATRLFTTVQLEEEPVPLPDVIAADRETD